MDALFATGKQHFRPKWLKKSCQTEQQGGSMKGDEGPPFAFNYPP